MGKVSAATSCWFLVVGAVTAQTARAPPVERALPQWLTGIIAVAGFLFLTFVGFLVKRAWCERSNGGTIAVEPAREHESVRTNGNTNDISLDSFRRKDDGNAYEDLVPENPEEKVTAM